MFDPSAALTRIDRLWNLEAHFGMERGNNRVFLDEIVSDRLQLVGGLQVLRDELQFAPSPGSIDREACAADFTQPSVVTTQAYTNCGDRIHHGETEYYQQVVASRFATISELGTLKPEAFHPTGGGTDDGATLAHVTWAHVLDAPLMKRIYDGNAKSFVLCAFDLKTHVGRDLNAAIYGKTRESKWREPRAACGAIVGTLAHYDEDNGVHRRIKRDLGDANFELLSKQSVKTTDHVDITAVVAAAIVAIQGMLETARALQSEMDERGLAHLTASIAVNRPGIPDANIYLARATVFGGELKVQGFGVDARKYGGSMVEHRDEPRLRLTYDGATETRFPIVTEKYDVRKVPVPADPFA
ncbi:MAG TPA: hypothetical protein VM925_33405 [Labilithrix sp.]|nr:hypothetical protein [Labilithrix sp.]